MTIELTTLPSGLRVITDYVPSVESVAVGIWADAGTRHEDMAVNGVAHMVEHMIFKGTPSRNALQIAEEIENVGGHMNAYTSRDVTAYHIHLLKEHLPLALDVLSDIVQRSNMPADEVERERQVILQEIGMTLDTPDDWVFDLYQETAYPGQAIGAPILGTSEIITNMKRDTLMDYVRGFYTPERLVISIAGNAKHEEVVALVEKMMGDLPPAKEQKDVAAAYQGGEHREEKELEQSHIVLGFEGIAREDERIYAASALSTLFGGGMSSRLFQEIREKRGLVYSIFSFQHAYKGAAQFAIYAGTGPSSLPELVPVLCEEIQKVQNSVGQTELDRAKSQIKSTMLMSQESMMSRANRQAKHLIHFGEIIDIHDKIKKIEALELSDITDVAKTVFAHKPTLAALGPLSQLENYDTIAGRLAA